MSEEREPDDVVPAVDPAGSDVQANERLDRDEFAETTTGEELAELIDEIYRQRDALVEPDIASASGDGGIDPLIDQDAPTVLGAPSTSAPRGADVLGIDADDILSEIMHEVDTGLSALVRQCVEQQRTAIAVRVRERLARIERAAQQRVAAHERELTARFESQHAENEKRLTETYDRLTSLANRISHQKADIQKARKALEEMLRTANRVHREVHRVGNALVDQIDHLDVLNEDINLH